ncbi:signal transduction histidine kinase [Saccharothrix ecbatanensis]|uniref:histidine kinase n=2 Tax=Saccharothrix ecbatanensis TaxID=1105145 RepID=A0A7W9LZC8_9PSEU|nr:ATP-binding protein [Saccharothrix ecbatanensis]MBB5801731.1 signal transduction histidine kinase [Saccharothrix ecbatanensis]
MSAYRTRWPASRLLMAAVAILILVCAGAIGSLAVALTSLADARVLLLDQIAPARTAVLRADTALINQESGVQGYLLTAKQNHLTPYTNGQRAEHNELMVARSMLEPVRPDLVRDLDEVGRLAADWRASYAEPQVELVRQSGVPRTGLADAQRGRELFDRVRAALGGLGAELDQASDQARDRLDELAADVMWLVVMLGVLLVLIISGVAVILYRIVIAPLTGLAADVRQVSSGDFEHPVEAGGPRETVMLGQDVEAMRVRILADLEELRRSNSELEQFAYVASHDLQEPLRKVASFCQLLERRYSGELDERGEQYLRFAVDGAKRMQVLINDLLAFSRVGRMSREQTLVDCDELVAQVLDNYSEVIERTRATVEVADLPTVRGEASLLGGVFGNLISNALKFHGSEPPQVRVDVERTGDFWTFVVSDKGIGIDAEYAERIFVIFQRLHHKDDYPGTGIGLAMCRKIIEYHGGTIWLDTETGQDTGTTFKFTLPAVEDDEQ